MRDCTGALSRCLELTLGVLVRRLKKELNYGAWQGAYATRAQILMHDIFKNAVHAHATQLYYCTEIHELHLGLKV